MKYLYNLHHLIFTLCLVTAASTVFGQQSPSSLIPAPRGPIADHDGPAPILVKPLPDISGKMRCKAFRALSTFFSVPGGNQRIRYEVVYNSDPSVAFARAWRKSLFIRFRHPGQTNLVIKASANGQSVTDTLVVGTQPVIWRDYDVSDFENFELPADSFYNGADGAGGFESGIAFFPNQYNPDFGSWSGWSYSNMANDSTPGFTNQYSAITTKGLDPWVSGGSTYGVSFAFSDQTVSFTDSSAHEVAGFFVTNSTYATLSMEQGDSFAKKFGGPTGNDPDFFKLSVWGLLNGTPTDTVEFFLADYRFTNNADDYIIRTWQWLDLSQLGEVESLKFSLSSSDNGPFGMNTPAYFCMDNLYVGNGYHDAYAQMEKDELAPFPNPSKGRFRVSLPEHSTTAQVSLYDFRGLLVHSERYEAGRDLDISHLPKGVYHIVVQDDKTLERTMIIKE